MKHIRSYKQHLEEGLIKTYDVTEFVKHFNKMIAAKDYKKLLSNAKVDPDAHVWLIVKIKPDTINFAKELVSLMNVLGYYVSDVNFRGYNIDDEANHPPKSNDDFLKIVKQAEEENASAIQLLIEPKFEEEAEGKFTILYHITEEKHLKKIQEMGLVPKSKSKVTYHPERIYLATKEAMAFLFTKYKDYVKDPVVLRVNVKGLKLYPDINAGKGTYFTTTNISPDKIKPLKQDAYDIMNKYLKNKPASNQGWDIEKLLSNLLGQAQKGIISTQNATH